MHFQGVGWGVGCFFKVLYGCWMHFQGVAFLRCGYPGCWMGCWILFKGVGYFLKVLDTF